MTDATPAPYGPRAPLGRRQVLEVLVVTAVGAAVALLAHRYAFPAFSWNRDEPVYLWQARTLRAGAFGTPDGGFPDFFHPWLGVAEGGRLYSQYTLGWPLVLLVGDVVFGTPVAGLAIGVALAVSGTYAFTRALTGDHLHGMLAAGALTLSPIVVVQGGVFLGYLCSLGFGLWFVAALLSGVRDRSRPRLVGAGLLLGLVFLTRPFDAFVWAAIAVLPLAVLGRRDWRRLLAAAPWAALGALPLFAATLLYNKHMTGSLGTFPVTVKDPLDTYGFGERRIAPLFPAIHYGIREAVKGTLKNGFYLFLFVTGGLVALPLTALGWWQRRREASTWVVVALLAVFPIGYFMFWGTNVSSLTSRISGPIYYVPLYAGVCFLIAQVVVTAARRNRRAGIALAAVMVAAGLPFGINRIVVNQRISAAQQPWEDASHDASELDDEALVFVSDSGPYLMFLNPYSINSPDLDGPVVWATDRLGHDVDLVEAYPDRVPYRMQASYRGDELGPDEHPKTPTVELVPLESVEGPSLELVTAITNPTDSPVVVAVVTVDGRVVASRVVSDASERGAQHEFTWTLTNPDTTASDDATTVAGEPYGSIVVSIGFGADQRSAARPTLQHVVGYRVRDGEVATVVPARAERLADVGGPKLRWRPAARLAEITLNVRPA